MTSDSFETAFAEWLADASCQSVSDEVVAFCFNLFEPADVPGVKFGIELIGAAQFDEGDPDWACDEIWEPETRQLFIPEDYSGSDWQTCLDNMTELVKRQLATESSLVQRIKHSQAVGIGFVDGDIQLIWKP